MLIYLRIHWVQPIENTEEEEEEEGERNDVTCKNIELTKYKYANLRCCFLESLILSVVLFVADYSVQQ